MTLRACDTSRHFSWTWVKGNAVLNVVVLSAFRLALLRVHSHGMVTIDLQCYQEDSIAEVDNVGDLV